MGLLQGGPTPRQTALALRKTAIREVPAPLLPRRSIPSKPSVLVWRTFGIRTFSRQKNRQPCKKAAIRADTRWRLCHRDGVRASAALARCVRSYGRAAPGSRCQTGREGPGRVCLVAMGETRELQCFSCTFHCRPIDRAMPDPEERTMTFEKRALRTFGFPVAVWTLALTAVPARAFQYSPGVAHDADHLPSGNLLITDGGPPFMPTAGGIYEIGCIASIRPARRRAHAPSSTAEQRRPIRRPFRCANAGPFYLGFCLRWPV